MLYVQSKSLMDHISPKFDFLSLMSSFVILFLILLSTSLFRSSVTPHPYQRLSCFGCSIERPVFQCSKVYWTNWFDTCPVQLLWKVLFRSFWLFFELLLSSLSTLPRVAKVALLADNRLLHDVYILLLCRINGHFVVVRILLKSSVVVVVLLHLSSTLAGGLFFCIIRYCKLLALICCVFISPISSLCSWIACVLYLLVFLGQLSGPRCGFSVDRNQIQSLRTVLKDTPSQYRAKWTQVVLFYSSVMFFIHFDLIVLLAICISGMFNQLGPALP